MLIYMNHIHMVFPANFIVIRKPGETEKHLSLISLHLLSLGCDGCWRLAESLSMIREWNFWSATKLWTLNHKTINWMDLEGNKQEHPFPFHHIHEWTHIKISRQQLHWLMSALYLHSIRILKIFSINHLWNCH